MQNMVVAKFRVQSKTSSGEGENAQHTVTLYPVYDSDKNSENGKFFKYTPAGQINLSTINTGAADQFAEGKEKYVYFMDAPLVPVAPPDVCPDEPIAESKWLRKELDRLLSITVDSDRKSRERSLAITKIEEAMMWLGKDLQAQGRTNPYPESKNPDSPVIHPPADGLRHGEPK